jgi:hypothetical protein
MTEKELLARIEQTEAALRKIARMKPSPIGSTGFSTGPLAMFLACQRVAREGLRKRDNKRNASANADRPPSAVTNKSDEIANG